MRGRPLQGVQDGPGADGVHREEVITEAVRGEELLPGNKESPS